MIRKVFVGALAASWPFVASVAQTDTPSETATLPEVRVRVGAADPAAFHAPAAPQVNKSSVPLGQTPQSITVVPRALLDSQQAQSLGDALINVSGVVSQTFGRRGWDDLIIRGQVASDAIFVDGLRTSASNRVAQELYGVERVEVVKGPASLLYGQVLPGGLVNMTSKRPGRVASDSVDLTVGSFGLRQGRVDVNRPLSDDGKAALRVNAVAMNSDDPTDHVWFRNRSIAPSLSLDLGPRTDFTLLASYQERRYIRQQGLPLSGSIQANVNGRLPIERFTGEPGQRPYRGDQSRLGYALTHRFDSGWTLHQNLRRQEYVLNGQLTSISGLAATSSSMTRSVTDQEFRGRSDAVDTHVQRLFETGVGTHEVTVGLGYGRDQENTLSRTCTVPPLNVFDPVYGGAIGCPARYRTDSLTTTRTLGLYARDQWLLGERTRVVLGLRRDRTSVTTKNRLTSTEESFPADRTTGSAALMHEVRPGLRPYVSYATSFFPNAGIDRDNRIFEPETGRQLEAGVKWDLDDGASAVTLAIYDLLRRNVQQAGPTGTYSIVAPAQRTRGVELTLASDLRNGLSLFGGYAYTAGELTEAGEAGTDGQALNNVPRQSFTLSARYRFPQALQGWDVSAGARGQGKAFAYGYHLPGYAVADAGLGYTAGRWRAAFNLKNLFDQRYYTGGLANAVAVGTARQALLNVGYRY